MQKNKKEKAKEFEEGLNKKFKKRRKTCRGGKEHDFLLTVPEYERINGKISPEMIIEYYKLKEEERDLDIKMREKYEKIGIRKGLSFKSYRLQKICKYYICSVCGKNDYK